MCYMEAHWHHLANTTEPPVCNGDAALCQINLLRPLVTKPNSITLASSELASNMFGASSELASVMEFGFMQHDDKTGLPSRLLVYITHHYRSNDIHRRNQRSTYILS